MSEGTEQFGGGTSAAASLESAANEFRSRVEDAAGRLSSAAQQFVTMSDSLSAAVAEARQAAEQAQAAQRSVEELRDQMARDYGSVSGLVSDLQERISALATLARPLAAASEASTASPEPAQVEGQEPGDAQPEGEQQGESESQQNSWGGSSGPSW